MNSDLIFADTERAREIRQIGPFIVRQACAKRGRPDIEEDMLQEYYAVLLSEKVPDDCPLPELFAIARSEILKTISLAKYRSERPYGVKADNSKIPHYTFLSPLENVITEDELRIEGNICEKLILLLDSWRTRKIMRYVYLQGMTHKQAGQELQLTRSRVSQIVRQALEEIKRKLKESP